MAKEFRVIVAGRANLPKDCPIILNMYPEIKTELFTLFVYMTLLQM